MISARGLAISIAWVVLSGHLLYSQDVKPSETRVILRSETGIQELELQPQRLLRLSLGTDPLSARLVDAPDLSRDRGFQFGMNLLTLAKQADLISSEAKVIHQRPALIQELEWRPPRSLTPSREADPVKEVLFSFYNGELFRIVVNYDRYRTEGLTDEDMVEAISTRYGIATRPVTTIVLFSSFQVYNDTEKVIARWEDSQYSFNLFRSSYQPTFGMLVQNRNFIPTFPMRGEPVTSQNALSRWPL